jgi:hypothetical protein
MLQTARTHPEAAPRPLASNSLLLQRPPEPAGLEVVSQEVTLWHVAGRYAQATVAGRVGRSSCIWVSSEGLDTLPYPRPNERRPGLTCPQPRQIDPYNARRREFCCFQGTTLSPRLHLIV